MCGRLLDGHYVYDGIRYDMKAHGFLRNLELDVVNEEQSTATFLLESNCETLKLYPFEFKFRVMYKLSKTSLGIYFIVENHSNIDMYYSVGCHEGYVIEGDLSKYSLAFDGDEQPLYSTVMVNNFTSREKEPLKLKDNAIKLSDYFTEKNDGDYLVIENVNSKRVTLIKDESEVLSVYYGDFKHLVLWTQYQAPFFCIEPWNGLPDAVDTNHELTSKLAIEKLSPGESKTLYHIITIIE